MANNRIFEKWVKNPKKYIILDTETTGLSGEDEVIEISAIDMSGNVLINTLVKPRTMISYGAYMTHGISDEALVNERYFDVVWKDIKKVLKNKTILCYNSPFDIGMIQQTLETYDIEAYWLEHECVMRAYMDYFESSKFISLKNALMYEGIRAEQQHRALDDCKLTLELIKKVASRD